MSNRYFVKSNPDAPENGPYSHESIKTSYETGMLNRRAVVRAESDGRTMTLQDLLDIPTVSERVRSEAEREYARANVDRNVRDRRTGDGSTNLLTGVGMVVAGIVLSVVTYSAASGGGRYVVFTGLIAVGLVRIVRGGAQ